MQRIIPKISVALCTYNGARFLREQLSSILNQSFPIFEIIIVDDCSSDDTLDIIIETAKKNEIIKYYVNACNIGFVGNFSLAISKTCGDYVALADQDDIWTEDHLEKLINNIGRKAVCVGDAIMINPDGSETRMRFSEIKGNRYIPNDDVAKAYRIIYNYSPYQGASMLVDREWMESFLPITSLAGYHDTYIAGCACLTKGMNVIPDVITKYRMHEGQVTSKWRVSLFDEIKHLKHRVCFPGKEFLIKSLSEKDVVISEDAIVFINEFQHVRDLDRNKKRLKVLKILNRHYKEIYSCNTYRHIFIRSLHFLFSL